MATKRSLFKKPAWAAQAKSSAEDGKSIFQQNIYEDILLENKKKEERRLAKQRQKHEQTSSEHRLKAKAVQQPSKRRRISAGVYTIDSDDDVNDDEKKFAPGYETQSDSDSDSVKAVSRPKDQRKRHDRSASPSPARTASTNSPRKKDKADKGQSHDVLKGISKKTPPDSDDELVVIEEISAKPSPRRSKAKLQRPTVPEIDSDSESDEYVKELKRTARAEAQSKKLQAVQGQEDRERSTRSPSLLPPGSSHSLNEQRSSKTPTPTAADLSDPEVLIRIKTIIPGCNEIFVKRKASQTLEGLEKYFVETHKLSETLRQKLFFTWNLQKLYKSTTMSSVLAQIKAKHGTKIDGSDRSEGRIELEAMTVEILGLRKQQLERERKIASGEWQEEEDQDQLQQSIDDPAPSNEPPDSAQPKKGIVIQLKSNNDKVLPLMALRVHPDTAVGRIIRGYKSKMKIDASMKVYLMFDGERLEGDQLVGDIGLEDEDCVDIGID